MGDSAAKRAQMAKNRANGLCACGQARFENYRQCVRCVERGRKQDPVPRRPVKKVDPDDLDKPALYCRKCRRGGHQCVSVATDPLKIARRSILI